MKSSAVSQSTRGAGIGCVAILFLAMFSSHLWASTFSAQSSLLKSIQNLASQNEPADIQVKIKEGTLCQALQNLGKNALGLYQCPKALDRIHVFSRTIRGTTWHSIINQLLSDYNTIVLWKNDTELESIYLLGLDPGVTAGTPDTRTLNNEESFLKVISKLRTQWANAPLSEELFNHPGFQEVFEIAEINSPDDWKDKTKQRRAKRELNKLYKITQQKAKDSRE